MNAIVALAAMLMTPLRQKPCQARRRLKATNGITAAAPQSSRW